MSIGITTAKKIMNRPSLRAFSQRGNIYRRDLKEEPYLSHQICTQVDANGDDTITVEETRQFFASGGSSPELHAAVALVASDALKAVLGFHLISVLLY